MTHIQNNRSLASFNTFGIDVNADYFVEIASAQQLTQLVTDDRWRSTLKIVLGEGSNILFTQDIHGLILKNIIPGIEKIDENNQHVWLKIGAGENWHRFVCYCLQHNYAGVENLSLIPGTVGAAPMQNIGAYGAEIKDVFEQLEAISLFNGELRLFTHDDCHFAYRSSVFKEEERNHYAIASVTLRLNKIPQLNISYGTIREVLKQMGLNEKHLTIQDVSKAVIQIRQSKLPDPKIIPNAGSFFKNPVICTEKFDSLKKQYDDIPHYPHVKDHIKIPAAWLIERCGWKGKRVQNVGVHNQQALVLVNYNQGSGDEIKHLAESIQQSVYDKFGIQLTPEVNII